ncbi:MAG: CBS domain-containing protein [Planctomycetota bacterium]|jgi:CBS domain-containing protein
MFAKKVRAEEIMTKDVVTAKTDTPIYDAMRLLRANEITGMPIVADDMVLLGILTEKDVLRLFHADQDMENKTAGDFMTRPAVSYKEDETLQTICDFMRLNYFRRVPVVSKDGKVVGIISRPDVIDYILQVKDKQAVKD